MNFYHSLPFQKRLADKRMVEASPHELFFPQGKLVNEFSIEQRTCRESLSSRRQSQPCPLNTSRNR
jgi:hypothetical protein